MAKAFWITDSRFKWISILLFLMFLIFMGIVIWQGENIAKDPCNICAKKFNSKVVCTMTDSLGSEIVFTANTTEKKDYHWGQ